MKRSLQRQLSVSLGGVIVLAGLAAALTSFGLAYFEAKEFQDDLLRQIAHFHVGDKLGGRSSQALRRDSEPVPISDPESRIIVVKLPRDARPDWLSVDLLPGFHTVRSGADNLRVFALVAPNGERTVAAQLTAARDEIAVSSALRTLAPLLFLLPLLVWLIVAIVRKELAPITRISRELDEQRADRFQSIAVDGLPDEIVPFVHAINRMLARVDLLIGQQQRFIADAAHELRSPLTALSLQAQNLMRAGSLQSMRERGVPLQDGIERARKLTEQLLSLVRVQAGMSEESLVDVSLMARELIAEYLPLAEAKGIDLGLEELARLSVRGSKETLRLIVKNGLENAMKYTPGKGEVTLRLFAERGNDIIEVVDNGPGIPASERERVLEPFYRLPDTTCEGSGLGLAIAREAANRLGGIVSLHGRPNGAGLIFRYCHIRMQPH